MLQTCHCWVVSLTCSLLLNALFSFNFLLLGYGSHFCSAHSPITAFTHSAFLLQTSSVVGSWIWAAFCTDNKSEIFRGKARGRINESGHRIVQSNDGHPSWQKTQQSPAVHRQQPIVCDGKAKIRKQANFNLNANQQCNLDSLRSCWTFDLFWVLFFWPLFFFFGFTTIQWSEASFAFIVWVWFVKVCCFGNQIITITGYAQFSYGYGLAEVNKQTANKVTLYLFIGLPFLFIWILIILWFAAMKSSISCSKMIRFFL